MYGSHDSLTGYPVKKWWMTIFQPFSKCQGETIPRQIAYYANFFDLRIRLKTKKDGTKQMVACHGLVEYQVDPLYIANYLDVQKCGYRVILENKIGGRKCTEEDLDYIKSIFISPCHPYCYYVADKKEWRSRMNPDFEGERPTGSFNCSGNRVLPFLVHNFNLPIKKRDVANNPLEKRVVWFDFVEKY